MLKGYINQWRQRRAEARHRHTIASLRAHLLFFGHDTSHLSDEQIEVGVQRFGMAIAATGVPIKEAMHNVKRMADAMQKGTNADNPAGSNRD